MKNFEDLNAWKMARIIRNDVRILTSSFPVEERYKLTDQLLRASRSITGRYHYQENIQYCRQARGSLNEVLDHLICAFDNGYIKEDELVLLRNKITENLRILNGYIAYLNQRKLDKNGAD